MPVGIAAGGVPKEAVTAIGDWFGLQAVGGGVGGAAALPMPELAQVITQILFVMDAGLSMSLCGLCKLVFA